LVKIKYTKTWDRPPVNWLNRAGDVVVALIVLFILLVLSFLFSDQSGVLRISNPQFSNTSGGSTYKVFEAYVSLIIWVLIGVAMFGGVLMGNYLLAPWSRWRKAYLPDENYSETTYECGETPIGEGRTQTNLQYYSFAIVFVVFDVITAFTLLFAVIFGSVESKLLTLLGYLFFALLPLSVLGFWIHKKAILWQ